VSGEPLKIGKSVHWKGRKEGRKERAGRKGRAGRKEGTRKI